MKLSLRANLMGPRIFIISYYMKLSLRANLMGPRGKSRRRMLVHPVFV
jgi:hypothetical protein